MARYTIVFGFLTLWSLSTAVVNEPWQSWADDADILREHEGPTLTKKDSVPAGYVAAPYYPAPHGGWTSTWTASYAKAKIVVAQMTLAEKVNLTSGTGLLMGPCVGNTGSALRFGIPSLCLQDGALGKSFFMVPISPLTFNCPFQFELSFHSNHPFQF